MSMDPMTTALLILAIIVLTVMFAMKKMLQGLPGWLILIIGLLFYVMVSGLVLK